MGEASGGKVTLRQAATTVGEIFHALRASCKMARPEIATLLGGLGRSGVFEIEHELRLLDALARVQAGKVDFRDAW